MGSFAFTCAVSGLPIEAGDPLRYVLLVENPYDDNLVCYSHDMWFPRTWPLRAKYNDYGSIDRYDEGSVSLASIVQGLKVDMVERGIGDNSCHDVPTTKDMSFEATLEAVWEKRLQVSREVDSLNFLDSPEVKQLRAERMKKLGLDNDSLAARQGEPPGLPTLLNVQAALEKAGFKVSKPDERSADHLMVDEVEHAWVRVRVDGYGERDAKLEAVVEALRGDYAAMITIGTGSYGYSSEVQVMPKPMNRGDKHLFFRHGKGERPPLHVYQAMILDEVWDELIAGKVSIGWDDEEKVGFDAFRADAQKLWDASVQPPFDATEEGMSVEVRRLMRRLDTENQRSACGHWVSKSAIPFTMGLSEHWQLATHLHGKNPFTPKQVDEFLDDVAGFSMISSILPTVRHWWKPSFSCGPQFGEHKKHLDVLRSFTRAGVKLKKRRDAKYR